MGTATGFIPAEREVEVLAKAERRRFGPEYKGRILQEVAFHGGHHAHQSTPGTT